MIPIIDFPGVVKEFAGFSRQVFFPHQLRKFKQYLSGLITGGKATVPRIASRLVDRVDQNSLNRSWTSSRTSSNGSTRWPTKYQSKKH